MRGEAPCTTEILKKFGTGWAFVEQGQCQCGGLEFDRTLVAGRRLAEGSIQLARKGVTADFLLQGYANGDRLRRAGGPNYVHIFYKC
jgi:hypothetical protein